MLVSLEEPDSLYCVMIPVRHSFRMVASAGKVLAPGTSVTNH